MCGGRMATGARLSMVCLLLFMRNVPYRFLQTFPPGRREEAHETLEVNFTYLGS